MSQQLHDATAGLRDPVEPSSPAIPIPPFGALTRRLTFPGSTPNSHRPGFAQRLDFGNAAPSTAGSSSTTSTPSGSGRLAGVAVTPGRRGTQGVVLQRGAASPGMNVQHAAHNGRGRRMVKYQIQNGKVQAVTPM